MHRVCVLTRGCWCTAMWILAAGDAGTKAQIAQQGGEEVAKAAKARFANSVGVVQMVDGVLACFRAPLCLRATVHSVTPCNATPLL